MTIGEIIYQNRKRAGLSQEELANLLNVTRQSISLWETDQSIPTTEKLICLADVFQISMDELCARNGPTPQPRTNPSDCIAVSETDCDEALYRKIYRITFRQTRFWSICAIVICAIWSIAMLYFDMKWTVVFPIFLMICLIVFLVSVQTSINNNIASQLNAHPHHKMRICFFIDRFEVEAVSDTSTSFYQKAYGELTRVLSDEEYFFLQFDNLLAVVKKADLGAERETIEKLLGLTKKETLSPQAKKERIWLLAVFFLTCFTLHLALIAVAAVSAITPDMTLELFRQNMWIFYCFTPIPIASIALGVVYRKRVRCKKNVVAGCIVLLLLLIYGSFPFFATISTPEAGAMIPLLLAAMLI